MEIVQIKCSQLLVNEGQVEGLPTNPRSWTKADIDRLARSLEETPELFEARPCIVYPYGDKYIVLGGNMRLTAAKKLKYKDVPCIVIPAETPIDKLKEIVIKDNGAFGAWDFDELANKWDDLPLTDWGVPAWEEKHLEETEQEATEDGFDEDTDQVETRCQKGNIWKLGEHRLMCGDSTSETDVAELMDGELADLVFTDPPYNVAIGDKNKALNALATCERIERNLDGDVFKTDEEAGEKLWYPAFRNLLTSAKETCAIYVTMPQGGTHMMMMMMMMMMKAGWQVKHELIWVKNAPTFSMGRLDYDYQHEPICFGWNKNHKKIGGGKFTKSVWNIDKPRKDGDHPTMKPVELIGNALLNSSEQGDLVIDFFGGSGSTMVACEELHRKCYMIEIDPHYCDVIIARWEKLTGKQAVKL